MSELFSSPLVTLLPTAFFTLALYSFLYRDNPLFRFAEHVFAGLTAGYYVGLVFDSILVDQWWVPLSQDHKWILLIPGVMGLMLFARFVPRIGWTMRIPLAFVIGGTAGIELVRQLHGIILPQVSSTILPLTTFNAVIMIIGVLCTLIYFFFSKPHTGALGWIASAGTGFIMVAFGAHFGYTVMARVSLLIGRIQFLFIDWLRLSS